MEVNRTRWRGFFNTSSGRISVVLLTLLVGLSVVSPLIWMDAATSSVSSDAFLQPSFEHLLGTDGLGRDILARTLVAMRPSLLYSAVAVFAAAIFGYSFGACIPLMGGWVRRSMTWTLDQIQIFPPILVALFVVAVLGSGTFSTVVALSAAFAPGFARLARNLSAGIVGSDYVAAARILGVPRIAIIFKYVFPNMSNTIIVHTSEAFTVALASLASLSFLGIGVQPPEFDWGALIARGVSSIYTSPYELVGPAVAIVIAGVALTLFGDAAARAIDPRTAISTTPVPKVKRSKPFAVEPSIESSSPRVVVASDLKVSVRELDGDVQVVHGVDLEIASGEVVGLVGESGSGKTLTAMALAGLLPAQLTMTSDRLDLFGIDVRNTDVLKSDQRLKGRLSVIFQDPMSSLNPTMRVGNQMTEGVVRHGTLRRENARFRAANLLQEVRMSAPDKRLEQFPHELSGGMRQRVMIALGLMTEPDLIIADEPTTALDVSVQAQIVSVLRDVSSQHGTAILFISHNLALVSDFCSRVVVMYAGRVVEDIPTSQLVRGGARHPYTRALLESVVGMDKRADEPLNTIPGSPPLPRELPAGCAFAPRCARAIETCRSHVPPLETREPHHKVACWVETKAGL